MTTTRTQTLSQIEFTEIIQINHIETRLKKNFQIIVDQLKRKTDADNRRDSDVKNLKEQLANIKDQMTQSLTQCITQQQLIQKLQKDKTDILREVEERDNRIKNQIEEMLAASSKSNPQLNQGVEAITRNQTLLETLKNQIARLRSEISDINKSTKSHKQIIDQHTKDLEELKKNGSTKLESKSSKKDNGSGEETQVQMALKDLSNKIDDIEKSTSDMSEHMKEKDKVIQLHTKQIWELNEKVFTIDKTNTSEHQIFNQTVDSLKRFIEGGPGSRPRSSVSDLQTRLRDLQRKADIMLQSNDILSKGVRGCQEEIETLVTNINSSRNMTSLLHGNDNDSKQYEKHSDIKRELLLKLGDQRREYMTMIKGLMNDKSTEQDHEHYTSLEDTLNELKHMLIKKADEENTRKAVTFLEKKINYIFNTFLSMTEEDARITRKNWFCLSCDRKLTNFTGKIGDYVPSPGPKGAKFGSTVHICSYFCYSEKNGSHQSVGLINSRYKSKSKLDLPNLQTTNIKRT